MRPSTALLARASRKLRLTTKQSSVRGGYYKGNSVGALGWHTKFGGYRIDPRKVRTYVVPADLDNCKLTPFVTKTLDPPRRKESKKALDGESYLQKWKKENSVS